MTSPHHYPRLVSVLAFSAIQQVGALTVTNLNDSGSGSLRAALQAASNGTTIDFDPGLDGSTITLTSAQLLISGLQVTVDASALPNGINLNGNSLLRVFAITGGSDITLRKLTISNGRAIGSITGNGGGIFLADGNLSMTDCVVQNCFSEASGGGICLSIGVTAMIERCRILGNSTAPVGYGGGLCLNGSSTTLLLDCLISGNSSPVTVGGISIANASPSLINCTVQGNTGGGLLNDTNSHPSIRNTIIWGNTRAGADSIASQQNKNLDTSTTLISSSLVQGASGSGSFTGGVTWGAGNLDGTLVANDPKFASPLPAGSPHLGGDLRLLSGSTSIDQGDNTGVGSLDLPGAPRILNTIVDLGAYEGAFVRFVTLYPTLNPLDDENGNGLSNLEEYGMGFDPTVPANPPSLPAITTANGMSQLAVSQRTNALDLVPSIVTSPDLTVWSEAVAGTDFQLISSNQVSPDRKSMVMLFTGPDLKKFFRQKFFIDTP